MLRRSGAVDGAASPETIDEHFKHLLPGWPALPDKGLWPPDVFAFCASALFACGAYVRILDHLRPTDGWDGYATAVGAQWEKTISAKQAPPQAVRAAWRRIKNKRTARLCDLEKEPQLLQAFIALIAFADEACAGVGIVPDDIARLFDSTIQIRGFENVTQLGTLTPSIKATRCRVLPKQHSPDVGLTVRSLTHHLALIHCGEVGIDWDWAPHQHGRRMNVLLAPWPLDIKSTDFKAEKGRGWGEFAYSPPSRPREVAKWTMDLLRKAEAREGRVDMVVFPEAALSSAEFLEISKRLSPKGVLFIAGVRESEAGLQINTLQMKLHEPFGSILSQRKHHRWRPDVRQIETYGLAGVLDPAETWWEGTPLGERKVSFVSVDSGLTISCLICEDLARQEPVAEVLRAVGPNLVIALLMDGPQMTSRWPGQYATVLADDPGCSVLTLTSAGMMRRSRPRNLANPSTSIALWKDPIAGAIELPFPAGADGMVLNLFLKNRVERTADRRSDGGAGSVPQLVGHQPITI